MDSILISEATTKPTVLTIEELNKRIRGTLETKFEMVWVQAEISNFKAHTSGHYYLSLKDKKSQIRAVMFRGYNSRLKFRPEDGMEVLVRGRITVYEPRGEYQLTIETIEPVGAGALQKAFEQLKARLRAEGLFEAARKRKLPAFPKHIAVVTSPTGAAIRDMMNILSRRNRTIPVTLIPTIVQGESCAALICQALEVAWSLPNVDVIIIGRGGGSIEDLWGFNDEKLARLIASSPVPVISAVGHEIDFTIADFVADVRAPTPSAAAELVAPDIVEIKKRIYHSYRLLLVNWQKQMANFSHRLKQFKSLLIDPQKKLQDLALKNDDLFNRLAYAMKNFTERRQLKLGAQMRLLDSLSPLKTVERGYAVVSKDEKIITETKQVVVGDKLTIQVSDGKLACLVEAIL